ncbi:hypothetical protein [Paraliomyxa miuraensis]|uniref:hypothetical protein n=1 Tax=Paraliomyxa miuraensis TaxID=376150 RepID=UPI00225256B7|nr:hypothetical protein [Paraliomyxa miuraensis]MCX4243951.1 hypothetical protein [Paraliomyxa miuraensis]
MNLADARVVLRPRTLGEILDLAARWCFNADRVLYARVAAAVLLPSLVLCVVARWAWLWSWTEVWLLAVALCTVAQGAFTVATSRALFEHDVSAWAVLRQWLRRLPSYVGALLVTRSILAIGAVTFVLLPSAWIRVAMVHEASLLEGSSPISATDRAWQMARFRGTEMALMLGGLGLAIMGGIAAAELLGHGLVEVVLQLGRPLGELVEDGGSLYALVGFHAAIPYVAVARFLGYVDQRTRGDGWDIQLRFMALAAEDARMREPPQRRAS